MGWGEQAEADGPPEGEVVARKRGIGGVFEQLVAEAQHEGPWMRPHHANRETDDEGQHGGQRGAKRRAPPGSRSEQPRGDQPARHRPDQVLGEKERARHQRGARRQTCVDHEEKRGVEVFDVIHCIRAIG